MQKFAYWLSPSRKVFPVKGDHIDTILYNPKQYGFKREEIFSVFKKYNEPVGVEGKARSEILTKLMKRGFIRVRFYSSRPERFSIQLSKLTNKANDIIWNWAKEFYEKNKKQISIETEVDITDLKGKIIKTNLKKIISGSNINEMKLVWYDFDEISNAEGFWELVYEGKIGVNEDMYIDYMAKII